MRFDILTIFPEFFESPFSLGIFKKAREKNIVELNTHDIRDYTEDKHRTVDDSPYGGGGGMLMKPGPIGSAVAKVRSEGSKSLVILTTPAGGLFTDETARELSGCDQLIIICGRYEGIDERVRDIYVDREISIGDYVLSGGEYAAAVIVDSVSRFIPGFLGNESSPESDSFKEWLLEYPQYTRPEEYMERKIPDVLLSGNHKEIDEWRREESVKRTYLRRPELLDRTRLTLDDITTINNLKKTSRPNFKAYIALVHYPVYNNRLTVITTAFTNLDVHDISRAGKTYGIEKFYLVQPNPEQQRLAERVLRHWTEGEGPALNKSRAEAMEFVEIKDSLGDAVSGIEKIEGRKPRIVVTDARPRDNMVGYGELRDLMTSKDSGPFLLVFGTGWGLTEEIMQSADYTLKPVSGYTGYNHLSVRSAAAIILDRLFSCTI
ncbi:MAG TPA: tRNA (guanosine(37)-N1)-methyltransferase TrmD [Thermodesulfobacteriota bacterium]|nr:tRNA (guanosine(37)-N1)-methyltransferase TrmD [Thermodesulfobacteriota bacterium]